MYTLARSSTFSETLRNSVDTYVALCHTIGYEYITMPLAPIDDNGTYLSCKTAARQKVRLCTPPLSVYIEPCFIVVRITINICFATKHGFTTTIFRCIMPDAGQHDILLVFVTLHDYPGSSLSTPTDINALRGPGTQASAIRARGREVGAFLNLVHREGSHTAHDLEHCRRWR